MNSHEQIDRKKLFQDLGYEPHPGQLQVHESTAERRILACGVRWGKTRCAAMEAIVAALVPKERSIGWIAAPTYDLCDRVFREIQVIVLEKLRHRVISMKENERRLILRNLGGGTSEIRGKTADNPVSLLGEGLDFLIVDEAARLKPEIWQSHLTQRLVDKKGWALLISTPRGKGWLYELFRRGQEGRDPTYKSWNLPSWTNPHLDKEVIDAERARLPERVFMQEFGGEFIEGSGAVFRYVREAAVGTYAPPEYDADYYGGLDLAKVEDYSVLTILNRKRRVVYFDRFNRIDWTFQITRITAAAKRYNDAQIFVDSTGAGEPIFEALRASGCRVEPYPFTAKSKTALIDNLAILLERKKLVLPKPTVCPELIDELESFEYSLTERGGVRSGAPSGIHDDCVISLALAAWGRRPNSGGRGLSICMLTGRAVGPDPNDDDDD